MLGQVRIIYNITIDFASKEKVSFDSILSINFEEDKSSSLALKSEYDALCEMLSLHIGNIEYSLKNYNCLKQIFMNVNNPTPENIEFWNNGICFNVYIIY